MSTEPLFVDWDDDDEVIPIPPWQRHDWDDLDGAELAALARLVRAAVDALPPADRLVADLALRAGRTSAHFDWPERYDPDDSGGIDVVAAVADVDLVRVARSSLAGWTRE